MEDEYELKKHIPDELLFEDILVGLPVKSLLVYKSVCKTWLYTIESRSFIETHRRHHCCEYSDQIVFTPFKSVSDPVTKSTSLLPSTKSFGSGLIKMTSKPLDVMLPPEMTRINWPNVAHTWGSKAEIILRVLGHIKTTSIYCVIYYMNRCSFDFIGAKIAICNPSTRDYKLASPFPPKEMPRLLELAATKSFSAHYGFGVAADGDYKVVVVVVGNPCESFLSYVYSMRRGAWNKIVDSQNRMVSRLDLRDKQGFPYIHDNKSELCPQVFLNGCWHWITMFKDMAWNVLTFNVDSETFKLVWGPPSYRKRILPDGGRKFGGMVSVLNGRLALLDNLCEFPGWNGNRNVISVWMMMEYGDEESWINVWRVNLESYGIRTLVGITYSLREDSNGGIQIERVLLQDYENRLVSCNEFGEVEIQQLGRFDTDSCIFWNTFGISAYSETLERLSPSKHDTKIEKSRKQLKERKNRAKKVRGVKKTKAGDAAKKKLIIVYERFVEIAEPVLQNLLSLH